MIDLSLLFIPMAAFSPIVAFWSPGPPEMLLVLGIALLLYGGKLPEVARTWGKTFAEFRRSLSGIQNDFNDAIYNYEPERLEYRDDSSQPEGYEDLELDPEPEADLDPEPEDEEELSTEEKSSLKEE